MEPRHRPLLIETLSGLAVTHHYARKLLVARTPGEGREALRALTAHGISWLGFEVTTTWQLAQKLAGRQLAAEGIGVIDAFDHAAILDASIDTVMQGAEGRLAQLAEGPGLRRSIAAAVRALRLAGIDAAALARTRFHDEDKRLQLSRIMVAYERQLDGTRVTDVAGVFRLAIASLLASSALSDAGFDETHVYVMPGLSARGLSGQLVAVMLERGAILLPSDPVHGLTKPPFLFAADHAGSQAPSISPLAWLHDVEGYGESYTGDPVRVELFAATSITAELREVMRRAMQAGLNWDEIEIVTTDPLAYGVALDGLAQTLDVPVTYAAGLPVSRTRPGRAVAQYLAWVRSGLSSDVLREMLERGDLGVPADADVSGVALARRLRRMRIGRGARRYADAFTAAEAAIERDAAVAIDPDDDAEAMAARRQRERTSVAVLRSIIDPLLAVTPDSAVVREAADVARLASGALLVLGAVPIHNMADATAHGRLVRRLERVAATAVRPVALEAAIAVVEESLDTRVPSPDAAGGAPWGSAGGHIYFSDLDHGGYTGRRATFVTGLDAMRFPGSGSADALLVDEDRHRLGEDTEGRLPDAAERAEEKRYRLAMLLSRLRGSVHLSYSTWDATEARALAPAAELLQAYRLITGEPGSDYDALHSALSPAASPVAVETVLDSDDAWLRALAGDRVVRDGRSVVFAAYPALASGYIAGRSISGGESGAHVGVLQQRASFDPRNTDRILSATQLQTLGTCGHRYLLRHVLGLRKPDDAEVPTDAWLTPGERGTVLHRVFDRTLNSLRANAAESGTSKSPDSGSAERVVTAAKWAGLEDAAVALLDAEVRNAALLIPPPGIAVLESERSSLREDVRAWCAMVLEDSPDWLTTELVFGQDGHESVILEMAGGTIRLRGSIDRVDRLPDGTLRVVDYKTGASTRYGGDHHDYDGGRRLQHVLYAAAAEQLLGAPVSEAEFQFPSRRSENHRATFGRPALKAGLAVADDLLSLVAEGRFYPTNDANDCRWCEYAAVCRVRADNFDNVTSPRAEWWRRADDPALHVLYRIRGT